MKKEVIGRRFTKRIHERFSSADGDDMREALDRLAAPASVTLDDRLAAGLTAARAQLRASGLPDAPLLHWPRGFIEPLTGQPDPDARACTLPAFTEARGFEADSREGLAAAIVWAEHVTRTATGADRDAALLDLGGLFALADVYAQTEAAARTASRAPRPSRQKIPPDADTSDAKRWPIKYGVTKSAVRAKRKRNAAKPTKNES